MEAAGLGIGVVGFVGQLLAASFKGYEFLGKVNTIGGDLGKFQWRLKDEQLRLKRWEEAWNRLEKSEEGDMERHVVATLARLVETFHDIEGLSGRYSLVQQSGKKKRDSLRRLFGLRRPSGAQGTVTTAQNSPAAIDFSILENATVPDPSAMAEELKKLQKAASDVETQLSVVMKFRWAMADQSKADQLVEDLSMYNQSLERYLTPLGRLSVAKKGPTRPKLFSLPFPRNDNFTGREAEIGHVHRLMTEPNKPCNRIAVHGMGGVGKTQLINEYAHRYRNFYSHIFWIHASRATTLHMSFAGIARLAGLKKDIEGEHQRDAIAKAKEWLESEESGNWLLIIDNGDDIFADPKDKTGSHGAGIFKQIQQLLPIRGNVVTMTRDKKIVGTRIARIGVQLDVFGRDAAQTLFKEVAFGPDHFSTPSEDRKMTDICQHLGYLPLAIDQAAAFMRVSGTKLDDFLVQNAELQHNPDLDDMVSSLPSDYSTTVLNTWEMSLSFLDSNFKNSSLLFQMLSFMDNDFIDERILITGLFRQWKPGEGDSTVLCYPEPPETALDKADRFEDSEHLQRALKALDDLSLLNRNTETGIIWVHDLVHQWLRLRMNPNDRLGWSLDAINVIGHAAEFSVLSRRHSEVPFILFTKATNASKSPTLVVPQRTFRILLEAPDLFITSKHLKRELIRSLRHTTTSKEFIVTDQWAFCISLVTLIHDNFPQLSDSSVLDWEAVLRILSQSACHVKWISSNGLISVTPRMLEHFLDFFQQLDLEDEALTVILKSVAALRHSITTSTDNKTLLTVAGNFQALAGRMAYEQAGDASTGAVLLRSGMQNLLAAGFTTTDSAVREYQTQLATCLTSLNRPRESRSLLVRSTTSTNPSSQNLSTLEALIRNFVLEGKQSEALGLMAVNCLRAANVHRKHFSGYSSVGYGDAGMQLADSFIRATGDNTDWQFAAALYWYRLCDYEEDVKCFCEYSNNADNSVPPPGRNMTWDAWRHCAKKLSQCLAGANIAPRSQIDEFLDKVEHLYTRTTSDSSTGYWIGCEAEEERNTAITTISGVAGYMEEHFPTTKMHQRLQEMAAGTESWLQDAQATEDAEDLAFWARLEEEMEQHPAFQQPESDDDAGDVTTVGAGLRKTVDDLLQALDL